VIVAPVRVQGEEAPGEIVAALRWCNRVNTGDVIITGRGGGSLEDLWAFNDERVARAIFASAIPVISAVGHEPDVTISDFVADVRAATPSHAAEMVAPDQEEWAARIGELRKKLSAERYFAMQRQQLDRLSERLASSWERGAQPRIRTLSSLAARMDALSPLKVLARGYAVAERLDGRPIRSVQDVTEGDRLSIRIHDGRIISSVEEIGGEAVG